MKYSVICPLCENGELLPITLDSFFHLDSSDYEVIFVADEAATAAVAVAETVRQRYPQVPSQIIVNAQVVCRNPKLNNVHKAWAIAGEWIMMADCNVRLPSDALQRLLARWDDTVGMMCSPPIGAQPGNFAAEIECAYLNGFEAKWQLLADRLGYGFAQGKVMFCQKAQIDALGGILLLDNDSCEDAAATKLIRGAGLRIRLPARLFEQPLGRRTLRQVWQRQVRWAKLRRSSFPLWYSLEIALTPVPLLIGLLISHRLWPVLILAACYGGECLLARRAGWHVSWRTPLALLMRDLMMIGVWTAGWLGRTIQWSGKELSLGADDWVTRLQVGLNNRMISIITMLKSFYDR